MTRWLMSSDLVTVSGPDFTPLLASWEAGTHPAQMRLQHYLDEVSEAVDTFIVGGDLGLRLEVDVGDPERLLHHYDLENYLTPLVHRLGAEHFNLVEAIKRVGGGSRLTIGSTVVDRGVPTGDWRPFECRTGSGPDRREWKERLREALVDAGVVELPLGPVAMEVEWTVSRGRNWLNLWKPTFDAMGPVLGEPDGRNPFSPADDRITSLRLHRTLDDSLGWSIDITAWWRMAEAVGGQN